MSTVALLIFLQNINIALTSESEKLNITNVTLETNEFDALLRHFYEVYPVKDWIKCCFFGEDFIDDINPHWMKFDPPSKTVYHFLAGFYFVVMAVGIFGNITVICMFIRTPSLRSPANTLIMNLAFSDLIMMCMIPLLVYNCLNYGPAIGRIGCKLYGFMGGLSGTVSICLLAAISYDRYFVIKFPLRKTFCSTHVGLLIGISWAYGIIFSLIPVLDLGLGTYVPEAYFISCSFDYITPRDDIKIFILCYFVAAWLLPFIIISYSYVNIIYIFLKSKRIMKRELSTRGASIHVKRKAKIKQEWKLTVTVLFVILLWFVAWTPYATVALLGICGRMDLMTPAFSLAPALFCKIASCLDPYVYAFSHPKFRKEIELVASKVRWSRLFFMERRMQRRVTRKASERISDMQEPEEEIVMISLTDKSPKAVDYPYYVTHHL